MKFRGSNERHGANRLACDKRKNLWIGATAARHARPLVTRNVRDFDNLPGVVVLGYEASSRSGLFLLIVAQLFASLAFAVRTMLAANTTKQAMAAPANALRAAPLIPRPGPEFTYS